jgi:hypothetical protein
MTAFPAIVDYEPRGSDGNPLRPHMEWDAGEGCPVGRDPREMAVEELEKFGHHKRPLLTVIRDKCIECCCGNQAEVRRCGMSTCPLWPFRMNSNPFSAPATEAQRERARENLQRARLLSGRSRREIYAISMLHLHFVASCRKADTHSRLRMSKIDRSITHLRDGRETGV